MKLIEVRNACLTKADTMIVIEAGFNFYLHWPKASELLSWRCVRHALPGWLSGERVGLMTWWLRVRSQVEATFLSSVFSPLTSVEACEKSSRWLWKEKLC